MQLILIKLLGWLLESQAVGLGLLVLDKLHLRIELRETAISTMAELKFMRLNVNRSRAANDLLLAVAKQDQVDILLVSATNRKEQPRT